jgi:glycosyltransferase involved in cell wall biosynthesis
MTTGEQSQVLRVAYVIASAEHNRLLDCLVDDLHPDVAEYSVVVQGSAESPYADSLRRRGVAVHGLDAGRPRDLPVAAVRLRRVLRRLRPDLVHSNLFWPSFLVEVVRPTMPGAPPSVLARHHNRNHHLQGKPVHVRIDAAAARRASAVLAVSPAVRRTLVELEGVPAAEVHVVENGLCWDAVVATAAGVARWRERFAGRRLVVAAGRLDFQKDYPTLLTALAYVRRDHPDVVLAVAHQNAAPDIVAALGSLAESLGVAANLDLLGPVSDVFDLMTAADVFVQSSVDESFGQTLLEAMALGVPLVATTPGGALDVVGTWYPAIEVGDAGTLARRIGDVLAAPDEARRRASAIAPEVRARFSAERMAAETLALYRAVVPT